MSNWFSNLFNSKCACDNCDHCGGKDEAKTEAPATPAAEVKIEETK